MARGAVKSIRGSTVKQDTSSPTTILSTVVEMTTPPRFTFTADFGCRHPESAMGVVDALALEDVDGLALEDVVAVALAVELDVDELVAVVDDVAVELEVDELVEDALLVTDTDGLTVVLLEHCALLVSLPDGVLLVKFEGD